jgi:tRNA (guanine37-N1)-methyltransferase
LKKIWIITLFPEYFEPLSKFGIIGSALRGERGISPKLEFVQLRNYTNKDYKGVDDSPFGGGPGMVIRPDVLKRALVEGVIEAGKYNSLNDLLVIFPSPRGRKWNNVECKKLTIVDKDLVFICGRYEGIDERFAKKYVNEEFSLGDFILSGGEIPTMAIIDSLLRFKDGVLGNSDSLSSESFEEGLLEYPQYTRPQSFEGMEVPEILLSGHHKNIDEYRKNESLRITEKYRPDLLIKK